MSHTFVALPSDYQKVMLFDQQGKPFRQVLWGDFLHLDPALPDDDPVWRNIVWAPKTKNLKLKIRREHTTDQRPLEIIFVDVGQGDGSVLITPERNENERVIIIDAGEGDEMGDFLDTRFGAYRQATRFHAAVMTHPDKDHYLGFGRIFGSGTVKFERAYHSGLVERPVAGEWPKLAGKAKDPVTGVWYAGPLVEDDATMRQIFSGSDNGMTYARVIKVALTKNAVTRFEPLSTVHGHIEDGKSWMPNFAPSDGRGYHIEVLGPFVEKDSAGKNRLRKLGDYGETKNGHSVLLRLCFQDFSVLFGGDLNLPAEQFLLKRYAGIEHWPESAANRDAMLAAVRPRFRSEVLKVCHHGSADVTDEFLEAVDPAAFVISSGDQEGHVHPRPDLLGRLGRKGRGRAPVLLSTELQRSSRDREDQRLVDQLTKDIDDQIVQQTADRKKRIADAIKSLSRSNVDVDGAIYIKTDGKRLITAFKKEDKSDKDKWFYFEYRIADGKLLIEPR